MLLDGVIAVCLALVGGGGCEGDGEIGASCQGTADCRAHLQCLGQVCVTRCTEHIQCGDGFICNPVGECEHVVSSLGSACESEIDCGTGQFCRLGTDEDRDGWLEAACAAESTGTTLGNSCESDAECRNGTCVLGACTQLCRADDECPASFTCSVIPGPGPGPLQAQVDGPASFYQACLQPRAQVRQVLHADEHGVVRIPVPSLTRSFALITQEDPALQDSISASAPRPPIGIAEVRAPACAGPAGGNTDECIEELYIETRLLGDNVLRYHPSPAISTLLVPNTPGSNMALHPGMYTVRLLPDTDPRVTVVYKTADAHVLDLNFYFLDMQAHRCLPGFDQRFSTTPSGFETTYIDALRDIFDDAGITIGDIHYEGLVGDRGRSDLNGLREADLPVLLSLSGPRPGINIFFVRSISPAGIQVLSGGNPGPPDLPGTAASGIAVAADTLCYRDWTKIARATAHAIGLYMGLFRNREPDGTADPIEDSDTSPDNLMYFGDRGGTQLSEGQTRVLHLYPGLR